MTVNGTGPYTHWTPAETFANDLDENRVPDKPVNLRGNIAVFCFILLQLKLFSSVLDYSSVLIKKIS